MELFIFGSWLFWLLVTVAAVAVCAFVENESGIGATVSVIIFVCLLKFCGNVDVLALIQHQPLWVLMLIVVYVFAGMGTAALKWWLYCKERLRKFKEVRDKWLLQKGMTAGKVLLPHRAEWVKYLKDHKLFGYDNFGGNGNLPPQVKDNKTRIIRWMSFWPVVLLWTVMRDSLTQAWQFIYDTTYHWLQQIADRMFSGVHDDLPAA